MTKTFVRSIPFWLLVALSLGAIAVGSWVVFDQTSTMTDALVNGTATGVEVYVGQSLVVVGAAILGTGALGILVSLALTAARVRPTVFGLRCPLSA